MEVTQQYVSKADFSMKVTERAAPRIRKASASLYQLEWSNFCHWCHDRSMSTSKTIVYQVADFFAYLKDEEILSIPAIKD